MIVLSSCQSGQLAGLALLEVSKCLQQLLNIILSLRSLVAAHQEVFQGEQIGIFLLHSGKV